MALRYVGRDPDSDYSLITAGYAKDRYGTIKVDTEFIASEVSTQAAGLITPSYADQQDALRAHKTNVDAADALYIPTSQVNATGGPVLLDGSALIPSGRLGTVQTERKVGFVQGTAIITGDRVVQNVTPKDFKAGTLSIADPGFPYYPMITATMRGGSTFGVAANRGLGTGSFAQMSVLRAVDDLKYSWCLCTPTKTIGTHVAVPHADNTVTPASRVCTGATTFDLWVGLFSGTTFTFNQIAFNYHAIVWPVFT